MHWDPIERQLCVKQLYQGLDLQEIICTLKLQMVMRNWLFDQPMRAGTLPM